MHGFTRILLPDDRERDLVFYLAMEEYVARHVQEDAFFVWRVVPTVIIGRNQDLESEVNLDYCREHGVRIVRRRSGGGCVYSDKGNIMISYVSAKGDTSYVFDRYLAETSASSIAVCAAEIAARTSLPSVKSSEVRVMPLVEAYFA